MDKVIIVDASTELTQIDLVGSDSPIVLERLGIDPPRQPGQVTAGVLEGAPVQALALEPSFGQGVRLLLPAATKAAIENSLAQFGATQLSDEEYSNLRIEAGLPAAGAELTEDFTPLEAGLAAAISSTKGCYTGQEVIARQLTYDKVTQHLCGLKLDRRAYAGERVWASDGSPVGKITSVAHSPRFGEIALAVVKRPHHAPGVDVRVGEKFDSAVQGRVVALPFGID